LPEVGALTYRPFELQFPADVTDKLRAPGGFHFTAPSLLNVPRIMDAFKNGGGIPYSEIGDEIPPAIERFFRPGYVNFLSRDWLGAVPGLIARLACSSIYRAAAGLQGSMETVLRPIEPVDQDFLDGLIVRWRLAEQYVEDLDMDSLPAERALTILMQHDFPMLLNEIVRLRPELR
jgi:hypothetical protein